MSSQFDVFPGWSLSEAASHLSGEQSLLQFLLQDRLVAASTDEKTSKVVEVLERDRWKKIEILDWTQSSARDGITRRKLHGLRIFPVIHSPNASARLAGGNLNDVILREVFHDPEVQLLAKQMLAEDDLHANVFGEGQYPGIAIDFRWPIELDSDGLAYLLAKPVLRFLDEPPIVPSPSTKRVAEATVDRWRALFSLLRKGHLVANGTYAATGQNSVIASQQWSRAKAWVDVKDGDLLEETGNDTAVRWSGVYLEAAQSAQKFHGKPLVYDAPRLRTIGSVRSRSHKSASVEEAIKSLWPNGIPESMSAKERNAKIMEWQKERGLAVASVKTIERHLKNMSK